MIPLQFLYEVLLLLLLLLCVKDSPFSMHIVDCNIKTVLISKLNFDYFVKAWFSQEFQFDQNTNRRKKNWAHSLYIYTQNKPHVVEIRLCSKDRFYRIKLKYTCKLNFSFNLFFFCMFISILSVWVQLWLRFDWCSFVLVWAFYCQHLFCSFVCLWICPSIWLFRFSNKLVNKTRVVIEVCCAYSSNAPNKMLYSEWNVTESLIQRWLLIDKFK